MCRAAFFQHYSKHYIRDESLAFLPLGDGRQVAETIAHVVVDISAPNTLPFWILPALALSRLKLKDIMGYTVVSMFVIGAIYIAVILIWPHL